MVGLKKIRIPLRPDELTTENIKKYSQQIFNVFSENKSKIRKDYEYFKGQHDILTKERRYDTESDINNRVSTPNLWDIINFKTGYTTGVPIEYAKKEDIDADDISYLKIYCDSQNMQQKNSLATEWAYAGGVGYFFIQPKLSQDIESDAPFEVFVLDADTCCKVYSSYLGNKPLFDVIYTYITDENNYTKVIASVYTENDYFEFKSDEVGSIFEFIKSTPRKAYKMLPLVERFSNNDRVSIVSAGRSMQDAIDKISSNSLDNIEDIVNEMLIIKNCLLGKTDDEKRQVLASARRNGVLEIFDTSKDIQADVETISTKLNHNDINTLKESLKVEMYDCLGCPLTDGNGYNNTGSSQEKGLGWDKAYAVALREKNNFLESDRQLLERMIFICQNTPDCPVDKLKSSQIEIKYNIARGNNLMTKAQSYAYFVDRDVPPEIALQLCELSGDPNTIGKLIELNKQKRLEREQQQNAQQSQQNNAMATMEKVDTAKVTQGGINEAKNLD